MTIYRPDELLALVLPHALGVMAGFSAMLGLAAAGVVLAASALAMLR